MIGTKQLEPTQLNDSNKDEISFSDSNLDKRGKTYPSNRRLFFFTLNIVQGDMNGFPPTLYLFLCNNVFVIPFNYVGLIFHNKG